MPEDERRGQSAPPLAASGAASGADGPRASRIVALMAWLVSTVWLIALIQPVAGTLATRDAGRITEMVVGAALFLVIYLWATGADAREFAQTSGPVADTPPAALWRAALPAILLTIQGAVMVATLGVAWGTLFIFAAVAAARRLPVLPALGATILLALVPFTALIHGAMSLVEVATAAATIAVVGVTVIGMRWSFITNRDLRVARRELARLAITEERLRFARDLHDLLGHTLSLITLKSELAGRLAERDPERARAEMGDIERAARQALRDVRAAVAGYRATRLSDELDAARELLDAAGITSDIRDGLQSAAPPPAIEAALAWAVREGCANTVRHSRARSCAIVLGAADGAYTLLIEDDGRGAAPDAESPGPSQGNGLRGLAERAARLGGSAQAGQRAGGGYALRVTLPVAPDASMEEPVAPVAPVERSVP